MHTLYKCEASSYLLFCYFVLFYFWSGFVCAWNLENKQKSDVLSVTWQSRLPGKHEMLQSHIISRNSRGIAGSVWRWGCQLSEHDDIHKCLQLIDHSNVNASKWWTIVTWEMNCCAHLHGHTSKFAFATWSLLIVEQRFFHI